jgi:hypothetical protein
MKKNGLKRDDLQSRLSQLTASMRSLEELQHDLDDRTDTLKHVQQEVSFVVSA